MSNKLNNLVKPAFKDHCVLTHPREVTRGMLLKKILVLAVFLFMAPVFGEAFGNNGVLLPKVGLALFDKPFGWHKKPWGIPNLWTVGTAFIQAIDYRWWWSVDSNFAMGALSSEGRPFISAFMGGAGVRYNIFLEDFRPHLGLSLNYMQFFGDSVKKMPLNLGWPIFVGLKPYAGLEWLIGSEMAVLLSAAYGLYININEAFRQVLYIESAFVIYF